jgi:hypothetical protein
MPTDIRQFLERYRSAFNSLDGEAVARLYAVPSGIAQDGSYTHWPDFEAIARNMVALCGLYRERGYEHAEFEIRTLLQQGEHYAVADLRWQITWSTGAEPWRFNTSYHLVRTSQGWRVLLCTAYAEAALHRQSSEGAA